MIDSRRTRATGIAIPEQKYELDGIKFVVAAGTVVDPRFRCKCESHTRFRSVITIPTG